LGQRKWFGCIAGFVWVLPSLVSGQTAMSQTRIASAVNNNQRVVMHGTTPALVAKSTETGRMSAGQDLGRMILQLAPAAQQDQKAAKLVAALHDPSSPSYHKWLTPARFGQLYGVSASDAAQVQQWLEGQGLTVHEISQSRRFIVFSGNVSQVEGAFATQMHSYSYQG
jgi:subtilase family serine protease